ncbi:caprin-2 isoform X4 [Hemicordylus capensis]|uniref:caprin-2 isoform X4 n=1 Tax=Hemicordylus capensis TaxID=884348 RepID=UPI00230472DB|nr:caprin-2 isoform X4 [Hemicordylus capensis]
MLKCCVSFSDYYVEGSSFVSKLGFLEVSIALGRTYSTERKAALTVSMVQLSQSPLRRPLPSCHSEEGDEKNMKPAKQQVAQGPHGDNQPPLSPLQATLSSAATASQAYETYIDNGLICLKHKIRNIEKKKLKLEDYKDRLKKGESLNQDQLEAVEKYDEVMHNLEFAKELQKTFSGLSQDLLKAQRKAQRRDTIMKLEAEKKKLCTVLQVQYVLQNFIQEHVQKDFRGGLNGAIYMPSKELDYLIKFAKLTCAGRNESLSVEDQMEQSSLYFWDLLEGNEKAVVGTTYKHLKDLLSKLLDSGYFENIPTPCTVPEKEEGKEEIPRRPEKTRQLSKPESVKEPDEPQLEHIQSEIQPQEFLNRHYLSEVDSSVKKPEELKPWEMEHTKMNEPPKSWEALVDMEEQEQKRKQESMKPLQSMRQQGKKPELSKPWEVQLKEDDHKQEVLKPWITRVREQQDSPKPWVTKVKEEQEQKQDVPKSWITKAKEEVERKQELPKTWVAQTRVETIQKTETVKPWSTCVREETEQKKQDPAKPWAARIKEEMEQKTPLPKTWGTSEESQQTLQLPLQNPPKIWGAANLVPKEQTGPKKPDTEPKEDGKTDGVSGQGVDAVRKKESLQSVGESCKLPRSLQNIMQVPKPVYQPAAEFCSTSSLPKDPILRREKLQDLMTQIQGTYNFMQESLLDFDKPSQSAICLPQATSVDSAASDEQKLSSQNDLSEPPVQVSASPMTFHGSNTSLASNNTLSGSETELGTPQTPQISVPLSQESENFGSSQSLYQASQCISEPLMPQKSDTAQAPIPPSESQIPLAPSSTAMSPVPQGKVFQSPPASSSSVSMKAAPFQAMQTVFKVNAPLPPRREDIKDNIPHSTAYNQNFSTASTQTPPHCKSQSTQNAEQTTFSQESLPNAANYQAEGAVPVSNGSLTFYAAQTTTLPRPPQPFVTSRGSVRGPLRGARSVTNSYRSPSGYKAGFEAYRGSPSISNGSYSQLPPLGRDYPPVQYPQRDMNYQQNYKRGGINSGRGNSRGYRREKRQEENCSSGRAQGRTRGREYARRRELRKMERNGKEAESESNLVAAKMHQFRWSDSSQVSSPERDSEAFNSGDSGQGDSRSITPVDMPVMSQAATILPVHVYPLPQQMRVAFSAARTSNLAPGTLDQPIVFDLLLNNLGETFDIQLGRFNCPVNGTYVFIFHMLKLAVNVPLYVNLMKNEEVLVSAYANDGAPDHETASNHAVLQLFQGDQIWLRLHRGAIYGSSWKYSTFSGYLLYQD